MALACFFRFLLAQIIEFGRPSNKKGPSLLVGSAVLLVFCISCSIPVPRGTGAPVMMDSDTPCSSSVTPANDAHVSVLGWGWGGVGSGLRL